MNTTVRPIDLQTRILTYVKIKPHRELTGAEPIMKCLCGFVNNLRLDSGIAPTLLTLQNY